MRRQAAGAMGRTRLNGGCIIIRNDKGVFPGAFTSPYGVWGGGAITRSALSLRRWAKDLVSSAALFELLSFVRLYLIQRFQRYMFRETRRKPRSACHSVVGPYDMMPKCLRLACVLRWPRGHVMYR